MWKGGKQSVDVWVVELRLHDLYASPLQIEPGAEVPGGECDRSEKPLAGTPLALLLVAATVYVTEERLLCVRVVAGCQACEVFYASAWWGCGLSNVELAMSWAPQGVYDGASCQLRQWLYVVGGDGTGQV